MKTELRGNPTPTPFVPNPNLFNTTQGSLTGALEGCLGSIDGASIEELLLHCATALEKNDVTLAQQVMWVLNNVASSLGDPNQRLTSWFLRALISRASRVASMSTPTLQRVPMRSMTVTELAGYVDLIPWHRFGFCVSNSAIFNAIQGFQKVHILDFSITHCMQWPTLIDAIAKQPEGPPSLRITVPSFRPPVPPLLKVSTEEVGLRLANFAKSRDVHFEFHILHGSSSSSSSHLDSLFAQLDPSKLDLRDDEVLVVNCQNWLRYLPDEPRESHQNYCSIRDEFLETIKGLNPCIVIIVDEDCNSDDSSLSSRITACFNYLWIPFDVLETFLPKDNCQRIEYESDIGYKIENIVGFEGSQRIERLESGVRLVQRMIKNGDFSSVPYGEETVKEVKFLLEEHAGGWGMKKEDDMLVLTWKGHSSVFATAWVPNEF